jgi:hypothetical protein
VVLLIKDNCSCVRTSVSSLLRRVPPPSVLSLWHITFPTQFVELADCETVACMPRPAFSLVLSHRLIRLRSVLNVTREAFDSLCRKGTVYVVYRTVASYQPQVPTGQLGFAPRKHGRYGTATAQTVLRQQCRATCSREESGFCVGTCNVHPSGDTTE